MKSRIPPERRVSKEMEEVIEILSQQRAEKMYAANVRHLCRRIMKLFCVQLNKKKYGNLGAQRLFQLIQDISYDIEHDSELLWAHTDQHLKRIGLEFPEDYDE